MPILSFDEILLLTRALQQRNINCCVLKGVTLPPESVPDIALRNQTDLDLLVRESDAESTRECLGQFGYRLTAVSGSTWEFKAGPSGTASLKNLYQVRPERAVDVQLIAGSDAALKSNRLTRMQPRSIRGHGLPGLSPADIFVLQGQHLFKHICSEHTRGSWLLEYWRHVCARRNDAAFWHEVQLIAAQEPGSDIAIGAQLYWPRCSLGRSRRQNYRAGRRTGCLLQFAFGSSSMDAVFSCRTPHSASSISCCAKN